MQCFIVFIVCVINYHKSNLFNHFIIDNQIAIIIIILCGTINNQGNGGWVEGKSKLWNWQGTLKTKQENVVKHTQGKEHLWVIECSRLVLQGHPRSSRIKEKTKYTVLVPCLNSSFLGTSRHSLTFRYIHQFHVCVTCILFWSIICHLFAPSAGVCQVEACY